MKISFWRIDDTSRWQAWLAWGEFPKSAYRMLTELHFDQSATAGVSHNLLIFNGERAGTRTQDPLIKSQMLYRLSYALPEG